MFNRAVIFANGELSKPEAARAIGQSSDFLIAADGGAEHCRALGLRPHVVIGDLDSLSPTERAALEAAGARIIQHPARKDATDLELALDFALAEGLTEILILGGLGRRWDQSLANLLLPFRSNNQSTAEVAATNISIRLLDGAQEIIALRGPTEFSLNGQPGDTVSLIPIGGGAEGLTTTGLEYPLLSETLIFGGTRSISNVLINSQATISFNKGFLICVVIRTADLTN